MASSLIDRYSPATGSSPPSPSPSSSSSSSQFYDNYSPEASPHPSLEPPTPAAAPTPAILQKLRHFLDNDHHLGSCDLTLSVSDSDYRAFEKELQKPAILSGREVDSIRYDYNPEKRQLTIKGMPTPVHNAIIPFVSKLERKFLAAGFLTDDELDNNVINDYGTDVPLPALPSTAVKSSGKRYITAKKQPDAAFYYVDTSGPLRKQDSFPCLVFEVAFSQSYESVVEDAQNWLLRTKGRIQLVIIVKLEEGLHVHALADVEGVNEKEEKQRVDAPVDAGEYVEGHGDSEPEPESREHSSEFSTPEGYGSWEADCNPDEWVGPITGFMEFYRYNNNTSKVEIDGERVSLFPDSPVENPRIKITDVLRNTPPGDNRTFALPLEDYKIRIEDGIRKLAIMRKAMRNKKLKRKAECDDEGDYVDAEGSNGEGEVKKVKRARASTPP